MIRRNFIQNNALAFMGSIVATQTLMAKNQRAGKKKHKNVLIFLADDQGYCEVPSYMEFVTKETQHSYRPGQYQRLLDTAEGKQVIDMCYTAAKKAMPNVSKLRERAVRFTDFHAAPTCGPSRSALMTGRYPQSFGVYGNQDLNERGPGGIPANIEFPVMSFKRAGYKTGSIGKWHLGHNGGQKPNDKGFDKFFGYYIAHTEKYESKKLYRNAERIEAKGWLCDQITEESLAFLKESQKEDKPFFLYVAFCEPKPPSPTPPQKYMDAIGSGNTVVDAHFGSIYGMDQGIGRILSQVKKMGAMDDTLIIYGNDNGLNDGVFRTPPDPRVEKRRPINRVSIPGNGELRGGKFSSWEGAVKVPLIAAIPGGKKGNSHALTSIIDIMPTALEYAGLSANQKLHGKSFLPILDAKLPDGKQLSKERFKDRTLFWLASDTRLPYKKMHNFDDFYSYKKSLDLKKPQIKFGGPACWYVRTSKWKLMGWDIHEPKLFDMEKDIGENNDVAKKHPEIVSSLKKDFVKWRKSNVTAIGSAQQLLDRVK